MDTGAAKPPTIKPNNFGFIMTRHVISPETNEYWQICYGQIRKFYPKALIIIIDDNSPHPPKQTISQTLTNCLILNSDFPPQKGELLPFHFFYKHPYLFHKAIVLHDSAFLAQPIDEEIAQTQHIRFLWTFPHTFDRPDQEERKLKIIKESANFQEFYRHKAYWQGCFGLQCIITQDALQRIVRNHNFWDLIDITNTRNDRMNNERIFAAMAVYENPELQTQNPALWGDIFQSPTPPAETNAAQTLPPADFTGKCYKLFTGR